MKYLIFLSVIIAVFLTYSQTANSRGKSFQVEGVAQKAIGLANELVEKENEYAEEKNAERDAKRAEPAETASNSSTSTNNEASSSQKPPEKSKHESDNGGVKEVYDAGTKSSAGYTIYRVKCNKGRAGSVFQKPDGWWYDGEGANHGDRFRNLSISDFAQKFCDY